MSRHIATAARHNRYLARQVDGLPNYHEALELADEAQHRLDSLPATAEIPAELNPLSAWTISDEWIDRTLDRKTEVELLHRHRELLLRLKRDALGHAQGIYNANVNTMLSGLGADLQSLLDEVSDVADQLDGTTTAEAAVTNDKANRGNTSPN